MRRNDATRPGGLPGAGASSTLSCLVDGGNSIKILRLRHLIRRVHRLGPRPVGEILLEFAPDLATLIERLEPYAALDPGLVRFAGASDWPEFKNMIRVVRRQA